MSELIVTTTGKVALGVFGGLVGLIGLRKWKAGGYYNIKHDLTGKVIVITGASTGIGLETAKTIAEMNATIILANRPSKKSENAFETVKKYAKSPEKIHLVDLDLSNFDSIRLCAKKIQSLNLPIHVLLNNAGVMMCPYLKTSDGLELQVGTNHVGHFLLTKELLPLIDNNGRIVNVSSLAHTRSKPLTQEIFFRKESEYDTQAVYAQSKLSNIYFTKELQRRLQQDGKNITVVALHPGVIATELSRHMPKVIQVLMGPLTNIILKTPIEGAQTNIYCSIAPEVTKFPGKYFSDCAVKEPTKLAENEQAAKDLWNWTEDIIKQIDENKKTK